MCLRWPEASRTILGNIGVNHDFNITPIDNEGAMDSTAFSVTEGTDSDDEIDCDSKRFSSHAIAEDDGSR